jgi:hypothetical protein
MMASSAESSAAGASILSSHGRAEANDAKNASGAWRASERSPRPPNRGGAAARGTSPAPKGRPARAKTDHVAESAAANAAAPTDPAARAN